MQSNEEGMGVVKVISGIAYSQLQTPQAFCWVTRKKKKNNKLLLIQIWPCVCRKTLVEPAYNGNLFMAGHFCRKILIEIFSRNLEWNVTPLIRSGK